MKIRVAVVDDSPVVCEGLLALVAGQHDMELAGVTVDALELVPLYERHRPDVVITGLHFRTGSAIDVIRALRRRHVRSRVVVLTNSADEESVWRAIRSGAQGYVLQSDPTSDILDAIRAVHEGRRYVTARPSARLLEHVGTSELTAREQQVLDLLARGESNRRIGTRLGIAEETVKVHVKNILTKLGAARRTEAVSIAVRRGIVRIG
ncbi:MAG TPA: response regulator transcription factor [Thermoanaerobaculia bacterium]|nr:response regulator transcription factor [Thermoanaerobaculia bacterium]